MKQPACQPATSSQPAVSSPLLCRRPHVCVDLTSQPACLLHLARLIRQRHLLMADWLWDLMMIADGSILGTTQEVTGHASATACRAYTEQAWRVHASAAEIEIN